MAGKIRISVKEEGPFFRGDPAKTYRQNVHNFMRTVARKGAADVRKQMKAGNRGRAPIRELGDHVSDHITGELRRAPAGPDYSAVVFVKNRRLGRKEAISLMAAASVVEGRVHAFASAKERTERLDMGNLLEGIE